MRVFFYPEADCAHDKDPVYFGCLPFSRKFVDITMNPDEADVFYAGQISEGSVPEYMNSLDYLSIYPDKHVFDIEGDWSTANLSYQFLNSALFTMNGVKHEYKEKLDRIFVRPTFSKNLMKLVKRTAYYQPEYNRKFSFLGFPDPYGIRQRMALAVDGNIEFTKKWNGSSDDESIHRKFESFLLSSTFSLCPRGTGVDSVRFLESCFYGRIPIVISDNVCFGHDFDRPFYFQIHPSDISREIFNEISSISIDKINEYSRNAVLFFNTYVKSYFTNPTEFFFRWFNARNS